MLARIAVHLKMSKTANFILCAIYQKNLILDTTHISKPKKIK